MYRREPEPVSRSEAYSVLAHIAQDLSDEVEWAEKMRAKNFELRKENEKLIEENQKLKNDNAELYSKNYAMSTLIKTWENKYYDLLQKYEPETYAEISKDW